MDTTISLPSKQPKQQAETKPTIIKKRVVSSLIDSFKQHNPLARRLQRQIKGVTQNSVSLSMTTHPQTPQNIRIFSDNSNLIKRQNASNNFCSSVNFGSNQ
jgi:hypothetical protein